MMLGISVLSESAGIQTGGWSFAGMDKLGHLAVFGLLGIAWVRSFDNRCLSPAKRLMLAVLLATGFGMLDEVHQYHNPLRTFEWADLLADFAGSVIACCCYVWLKPLRQLLETEILQSLRLRSPNNKTDFSS